MNVLLLGNLTHPVKPLAWIVISNVVSIDHHLDLGVARARFIYALFTDVSIDFASIVVHLMKTMFSKSSISLPYRSPISWIIAKFFKIPRIEPIVKPLGPFCQATVRRSKS